MNENGFSVSVQQALAVESELAEDLKSRPDVLADIARRTGCHTVKVDISPLDGIGWVYGWQWFPDETDVGRNVFGWCVWDALTAAGLPHHDLGVIDPPERVVLRPDAGVWTAASREVFNRGQ